MGTERLEEIAEQNLMGGMSEAQRRLYIRGQVAEHNLQLAGAANDADVINARDFALFHDWGYMGLYASERARDIAARKGLRKGEAILDYMGSQELAANLFRATQTEAKLRRGSNIGKDAPNATHYAVGREVRETIQRLGGAMPEDLPTPAESIQQLQAASVSGSRSSASARRGRRSSLSWTGAARTGARAASAASCPLS